MPNGLMKINCSRLHYTAYAVGVLQLKLLCPSKASYLMWETSFDRTRSEKITHSIAHREEVNMPSIEHLRFL